MRGIKLYEVKSFASIIEDAAKTDLTDFDAADFALKKANDKAAMMTNGSFRMPSLNKFMEAIISAREKTTD